ncbi:MAG: hypothetical protein LUH05_05070, partial [Candidatus Gastranaerophilales bacterium]|nr:hypothetical protein [Candidatus Gastranaerophilales bacterium]
YKHDVLEASISGRDVLSDLKDFICRLDIVSDIVKKDNYSQFHEAINRIIRLIQNENNFSKVNENLFVNNSEKSLWSVIKNIDETALSYNELEEKLVRIIPFINEFFDKVLVMDKDEEIKRNRINMLNIIKLKFAKIADFSKIVF